MKKLWFFGRSVFILCLLLAEIFSCATQEASAPAELSNSEKSFVLDAAIGESAEYLIERLPQDASVALLPFDAPTGQLADYIVNEMWNFFEDSGRFIMVDRRNQDRIDAEIQHQLESGRVDDSLAVSITQQYGARILVHGAISVMGKAPEEPEYRMTVFATDVEKAVSSQRSFTVNSDRRLAYLLETSLNQEVERAIAQMAAMVKEKIYIAVGRISYTDTQSVSSFSAWLKNNIIFYAQGQRDKFYVASESECADFAIVTRGFTVEAPRNLSPIQAVITGYYSPLDSGAEVSLYLVSTEGNKAVLASAKFAISANELERRQLSLLPEKGNSETSLSEFEAKHNAIDPYSGRQNRWDFTVTADVLDGIYSDGDFMSMNIYSEKDCFFRIIHVDVNGNIQIIYPVAEIDNNFIRAGETRIIPDNFRYKLGPPFGEELILAAAYSETFSSRSLQPGLPLSEELITRSLAAESSSQQTISPIATTFFSYIVLPGL